MRYLVSVIKVIAVRCDRSAIVGILQGCEVTLLHVADSVTA